MSLIFYPAFENSKTKRTLMIILRFWTQTNICIFYSQYICSVRLNGIHLFTTTALHTVHLTKTRWWSRTCLLLLYLASALFVVIVSPCVMKNNTDRVWQQKNILSLETTWLDMGHYYLWELHNHVRQNKLTFRKKLHIENKTVLVKACRINPDIFPNTENKSLLPLSTLVSKFMIL